MILVKPENHDWLMKLIVWERQFLPAVVLVLLGLAVFMVTTQHTLSAIAFGLASLMGVGIYRVTEQQG